MSALVTLCLAAASIGGDSVGTSAWPQWQLQIRRSIALRSSIPHCHSSSYFLDAETCPQPGPGPRKTAAASPYWLDCKSEAALPSAAEPRTRGIAMINRLSTWQCSSFTGQSAFASDRFRLAAARPVVVQSMTMTDTADAAGDRAAVHRARRGGLGDGARDRQRAGSRGRRARDQAADARRRRHAPRSSATSTTTAICC